MLCWVTCQSHNVSTFAFEHAVWCLFVNIHTYIIFHTFYFVYTGGPCHLLGFKQCSGDLLFLFLVYLIMEKIHISAFILLPYLYWKYKTSMKYKIHFVLFFKIVYCLFFFTLPCFSSSPFLFSPLFLFLPLYLTRSVSHPEEIKNADGSWVVTVTVLWFMSSSCPAPFSPPPLSPALPYLPCPPVSSAPARHLRGPAIQVQHFSLRFL